jgi:hypothetical protein
MNRYISIGLSIAVAPAILLGYGQWTGSSDTIEVSTFAVALALPLGAALVVAGIVMPASKKVIQSTGITSLRARYSNRQIFWGTTWAISLAATLWFLVSGLTTSGIKLPEDWEVTSLPLPEEAAHSVSLESSLLHGYLGFLALAILIWFALLPWARKREARNLATEKGTPFLDAATATTTAIVILISMGFAYFLSLNITDGFALLGIGFLAAMALGASEILHLIFLSAFIYKLFRYRYVTFARVGVLVLGIFAATPIMAFPKILFAPFLLLR